MIIIRMIGMLLLVPSVFGVLWIYEKIRRKYFFQGKLRKQEPKNPQYWKRNTKILKEINQSLFLFIENFRSLDFNAKESVELKIYSSYINNQQYLTNTIEFVRMMEDSIIELQPEIFEEVVLAFNKILNPVEFANFCLIFESLKSKKVSFRNLGEDTITVIESYSENLLMNFKNVKEEIEFHDINYYKESLKNSITSHDEFSMNDESFEDEVVLKQFGLESSLNSVDWQRKMSDFFFEMRRFGLIPFEQKLKNVPENIEDDIKVLRFNQPGHKADVVIIKYDKKDPEHLFYYIDESLIDESADIIEAIQDDEDVIIASLRSR